MKRAKQAPRIKPQPHVVIEPLQLTWRNAMKPQVLAHYFTHLPALLSVTPRREALLRAVIRAEINAGLRSYLSLVLSRFD